MIDRGHGLPLVRQAALLKLSRSSLYYEPRPVPAGELAIMRRIDALHLDHPFAGSRMRRDLLRGEGVVIGRERVATMMRRMGSCCTDQRDGRNDASPAWGHAMRTDSGRPSSSMRFRAWTATSTSVPRRWSVRERSPSPITRLNLPMPASARARVVYPDAFCQAARPCSAMNRKWRSRCAGAVSAVSLGTAVERGGTMTAA